MIGLTPSITRLLGSTGMSARVATTLVSDPNLTYAKDVHVFVTTTESPPPASATLAEVVVAPRETVPVGRNGMIEPIAIMFRPVWL
jgi:hypothetical protein